MTALVLSLLLCVALFSGCREKQQRLPENSTSARALFEQTTRDYYVPSAEATGAERERLLNEAAKHYSELLARFPGETNLCVEALRALGNVCALQGKTNEAVKLFASLGEKYPAHDWDVLMAWKSAADLLWDSNRRDDAKKYYARIAERFGKGDAPQIIQTVVRASKARLAD
jgi:tetratricopeptide (TPR) repeat protein